MMQRSTTTYIIMSCGACLSPRSQHPLKPMSWGSQALGRHLQLLPPPPPRLTSLWRWCAPLQEVHHYVDGHASPGSTSLQCHWLPQMATAACDASCWVMMRRSAAQNIHLAVNAPDLTGASQELDMGHVHKQVSMHVQHITMSAYPDEGHCEICRPQGLLYRFDVDQWASACSILA